ncbi:MAG TPA: cation transporter [Gammaproteobacteria bacterium]|nr:cation transporter [Gammaproteobacteria bacterium]
MSLTLFVTIDGFKPSLSAVASGGRTYPLSEAALLLIDQIGYAITLFFGVELLVRFIGEPRKRDFLKNGWNVFDSAIVLISIPPINRSESAFLLRLLRIFRVLRLISVLLELRFIIDSMLKAIPRIFYVCLLLFIIVYIYGPFGSMVFADTDPARWSGVGTAMLPLVQVMTLSSWETVMLPIQQVFPFAWICFMSFIFIARVAVLVGVMNAAREQENADKD